MSSFTMFNSDTDMQRIPDAANASGITHWRLTKELVFFYNDGSKTLRIVIPVGYLFSGRTIPVKYSALASPTGKFPQLAALHEYLCEHGVAYLKWEKIIIPVAVAHLILRQACGVLMVGYQSRFMVYEIESINAGSELRCQQDCVKNKIDNKSYGNSVLDSIRLMLVKPT